MISIQGPEIVNGLQTSYQIFNYQASNQSNKKRSVLVRVILPPDEKSRRRIIKATNFQTPVSPLSLHATEDIHFDIEELLTLYGVYYDRKKGKNRRLGRPISKIVSIRELSQAVMSIALWRPDDARGRPETVLKRESVYNDVFDVAAPRELFAVCILLDKQISAFLSKEETIVPDMRIDLHYYTNAWVGCSLCGSPKPSKAENCKSLWKKIATDGIPGRHPDRRVRYSLGHIPI